MKKLPKIEYMQLSQEEIDDMLVKHKQLQDVQDDMQKMYIALYSDDEILKRFLLIFISKNQERKLEGYSTEMTVKQKNRNHYVNAFALLMVEFFPNLILKDVFNMMQHVQWEGFHLGGYWPYSNKDAEEIIAIKDKNPVMMFKVKNKFQGFVYVPMV
jgi:hypothetical protein